MIHSKLNSINTIAKILLSILAISVVMGYFANLNWVADLFVHFQIQYLVGAILLLIWFAFRKQAIPIIICIVLFASSAFQIYSTIHFVTPSTNLEQTFKIIQYNRKFTMPEHETLVQFIAAEKPDIIVIQEARQAHVDAVKALFINAYPYRIIKPRENAFGMIVLSKHPLLKDSVSSFKRIAIDNFLVYFVVQPAGFDPISVYAIHPTPPMTAAHQEQRNRELNITAKKAGKDPSLNVIMIGDWNVTPFSPYFKDILKNGNLQNHYTHPSAIFTWPSFFLAPVFQIPIDHILYKGKLELKEKKRAPAFGSDHYPIIATFSSSD